MTGELSLSSLSSLPAGLYAGLLTCLIHPTDSSTSNILARTLSALARLPEQLVEFVLLGRGLGIAAAAGSSSSHRCSVRRLGLGIVSIREVHEVDPPALSCPG